MATKAARRMKNGSLSAAKRAAAEPREAHRRPRRVSASIFDRNEQFRLKRRELLRAAVRVFNQRGATNTSLDDVAKELGITKAALYYYFESKQDMLLACYTMSLDLSDDTIALAHRQGKTGREKLEIYIRTVLEEGLSELNPTIGLRQQLVLEPEYLDKLVKRRRLHRDSLRRLIAEGVKDGTIIECSPVILQSLIAGAHSWIFMSYRHEGTMTPAEVASEVARLLANGFSSHQAR